MTRIHTILALLMGVLFLTTIICGGCDPEDNPGDDDDDVTNTDDDDDVTDDDDTGDDDDTTPFSATIYAEAPDGFSGAFTFENGEPVGSCDDADHCTCQTEHQGEHEITFEADNALFLDQHVNIIQHGQYESVAWSGPDGEWGLAPNGTYDVYEGVDGACNELGDYVSTEQIETTINGDEITLTIVDSAEYTIYGEYFGPSFNELIGTINIDPSEFRIDYPTVTHCYLK